MSGTSVSMSLPKFSAYPPANVRKEIPLQSWQHFQEAWIALTEASLGQTDAEFTAAIEAEGSPAVFVKSYIVELSAASKEDAHLQGPKSLELKRSCFLLVHRLLSTNVEPKDMLDWSFLAKLCLCYPKSNALHQLFTNLWNRRGADIEASLEKSRRALTATLDSPHPSVAEEDLKILPPFLHTSSDAGKFMLTGSEFVDALTSAHNKVSPLLQQRCTNTLFFGLLALITAERPNFSMFSDHLYSLRTSSEALGKTSPGAFSLLADLITNTPFIKRARQTAVTHGNSRIQTLLVSLEPLRQTSQVRSRRSRPRLSHKGKAKATDDYGHDTIHGGIHVHRMSLISQVQELFPELGTAFIVKLLDEYQDDVEQATAHYLEGTLPTNLQSADRTQQLDDRTAETEQNDISALEPRSTPPPQRRNVYDHDEFDRLAMDPSRVYQGRKDSKLTADALLADRTISSNKAAIMSALAAFDSDDDERDDTYDVEDVGGTIDTRDTAAGEADVDKNEEALFQAFKTDLKVFERDTATRKSKPRAALRNETGMTDEAIEGWAIMVRRDPRWLRRLEARFAAFAGQQTEVARTSFRASNRDSGVEESDDAAGSEGQTSGARGRGGRGRGPRGRGGRGGSVAGPTEEKGTQVSRQRKETNKSSRANHNRRDQRARKMARGGFAG